jgi:hypothetical protein
MKIDFDKPHRRRDGHVGARAYVRCVGSHPKTYAFDTHGMTSTQVAEKINAFAMYHDAKMAKLREYGAVRGVEFVVDGTVYRVVDCTIFDAGVELYVDVRRVEESGMFPVAQFPLRMKYRDIALLPSVTKITDDIRAALPTGDSETENLHHEFVTKVRNKMKERADGVPR